MTGRTGALVVGLAAWLGAALLFAAVVAPAAFAALPNTELAGAVVGRVLPTLFVSGIIVGLAAAVLNRAGGPRWAFWASLLAAASAAAAQLLVTPRIDALRRAISGPVAALDAADPRRHAFGRLHVISVACYAVTMLACVTALAGALRTERPDG